MKVTIKQIEKHFDDGGEICAPFIYTKKDGSRDWYYVEVNQEDLIRSMQDEDAQELIIDRTILNSINWFISNEDQNS